MSRALLLFLPLAFVACVLDRGEDRRPEILPGRYRATGYGIEAQYEFRADGTFVFTRTDSGNPALKETGRWEYSYIGPEERYLIESDVIRSEPGTDSAWHETFSGRAYRYPIAASSRDEFHLIPGMDDMPGGLFILLAIEGPSHVVFRRQ